jgi:opacity protein-like surface antigen
MTSMAIFMTSEGTMPKPLLLILLLLGLTLSASPVQAATSGPYLEVEGYGTWLNDSKNQTDAGTFNSEYDGGAGGGLALGYDFAGAYPEIGRGRVELEAAYRRNSVKNLEFAEGTLSASGDVTVKSLMVNTIVEYKDEKVWIPYLLLGLGYADVSISKVRTEGTNFISSSSDGVFAYQVGAGLGVGLGDHFTLDIGYRYFGTLDPSLELADGSSFDSEIGSHNLVLGLRFKY